MRDEKKLYITKNWVIVMFIYYFLIFILGILGVGYILFVEDAARFNVFQQALIGSMSIALAASAAAYIRKLYKICFKISSDQDNEDQIFFKRLGTIVYFIVRPIFSILFAILVVAGIRSGIILSTSAEFEIDNGFIYLTMVSSFYVGFLSGDFITKLEAKGQKKLDTLVG